MDDSSIVTVDYHMVADTSLDKRTTTDVSRQPRVIPVRVYDISNDKLIDWNANEPKPPTGHNIFVLFMTAFLIGVGALGFMSYTLSLAFDPPQIQRIR